MGKVVQVNPGYSDVTLPPQNLPFASGASTTLTDAEYAGLGAQTLSAITLTSSTTDPTRPYLPPLVSLPAAVNQAVILANAYTDGHSGGSGGGIPMIRPEQHGAAADGVTDDSEAYYQAIVAGLSQTAGAGCYIQLQQGKVYYIGKAAHNARPGRVVTDGGITNNSGTLTSLTANFTSIDVGTIVTGTGIPANTMITSLNSSSSVQLSQNATATTTGLTVTLQAMNGLIDLRTGVYMGVPGGSGKASTGATRLVGDSTFTGYIIDTVSAGAQGCGLNGFIVQSNMSTPLSTPCSGVRLFGVIWGHIRDFGIGNVSDIGLSILGSVDCHIENVGVSHNISNRVLTDITPAFFINGTDHVFINIEANGGTTNATIGTGLTGTAFWNPAVQLWGALTCKFWGVNGEFADVGWTLGGTSSATGVSRHVNDGVLNGTSTLTSATANFQPSDVGKTIIATGVPAGTIILSRTNSTTVGLSAVTGSGSGVSVTITVASTFVSLNQFNDVRGDYNAAHGFYVIGAAWNQFHSTTVYNNSNNSNGAYDGVYLVNSLANVGNRFTAIMGGSPPGTANIMGYYYHDAATGGVSQMDANIVATIGGQRQGMVYDYMQSGLPYRFAIMRGSGIGSYVYRLASRYMVGQTWVDIINTTGGVPTLTYSDGAGSAGTGGWRLLSTGAVSGNILNPLTSECLGGSSAGWLGISAAGTTSPPVTTPTATFAAVAFNTIPSAPAKLGNNQILAVTCNAAGVTAGYMEVLTIQAISGIAASTNYAAGVETVAGSTARNVQLIVDCFSNTGAYLGPTVATDAGANNSTTGSPATLIHSFSFATLAATAAIQLRVRFTGCAFNEVHYVGLTSVDTHSTATVPVYS